MSAKVRTNERGNKVSSSFVGGDRYVYDFKLCTAAKGYRQFDTAQDFAGFGCWVSLGKRQTVTFTEGDLDIVDCPTVESLKAELQHMEKFYGPPPPAFTVIGQDGSVMHVFDKRPTVEEPEVAK